ncbi:hypothetical protein SD961_16590 [Erwinia sp. MMLR14_017]|uniref:hypothetical protein n=1 Tax=Erwinia sp. MMLR14_017 TaxID=3093842 RepID=UPI00298FC527|nr:hypothetical protein [Erwinia sp. MMLR14_017]MDW8847484.1 hypothetical protein [Erwinia sp. MMLR14_017]
MENENTNSSNKIIETNDSTLLFSDDFSSGLDKWDNVTLPAAITEYNGVDVLILSEQGQLHKVFKNTPDEYCFIKTKSPVLLVSEDSTFAITIRTPTISIDLVYPYAGSGSGTGKCLNLTTLTPCKPITASGLPFKLDLSTLPNPLGPLPAISYVSNVEVYQTPIYKEISFNDDSWKEFITINEDFEYEVNNGELSINATSLPAKTLSSPKKIMTLEFNQPGSETEHTAAGAFYVMSAQCDEKEKVVEIRRSENEDQGVGYLYSDIEDFANEFFTGINYNTSQEDVTFKSNMSGEIVGSDSESATIKIRRIIILFTKLNKITDE